jgi:GNAT superfamily N-acetyltransferase
MVDRTGDSKDFSLSRKERVEKIQRMIPDEILRHILFNFDDMEEDFLCDSNKYLDYLSNIMTFTMLTVWNIYLIWKRSSYNNCKKIDANNNSFWRIYNMLDKSCDPTKISGEFIDDLMVNLEIDCLIDTDENTSFVEALGISGFFAFNGQSNKLSRYIYSVKQKRLSTRYKDSSFDFDSLCYSIRICAYLHDIRLEYVPMNLYDNGVVRNDFYCIRANISDCVGTCPFKEFDYLYSLCVYNDVATYYIEDFQTFDERRFNEYGKKPQYIRINYVQLGDRDRFHVVVSNESIENFNDQYTIIEPAAIEKFFLNCDIVNLNNVKSNDVFFRDYILLNNNFLKELAYTIADAISVKTCGEIIAKYSSKYQGIFDKMYVMSLYNEKEIVGYRWDEIILFLLLEEGVYEFLRFLLNHEKYDSFRLSFIRRFGSKRIDRIIRKGEFITNPEAGLPVSASLNAKNDCRAKAIIMLAAKLLTNTDWELDKSILPMTIDNIKSECDRVYKISTISDLEKATYFSNMILYVLRFICKFYKGVFQYSHRRMKALYEVDINSEGLLVDDYKRYQRAKEVWITEIKTSFADNGLIGFMDSTILVSDQGNGIVTKIDKAFKKLFSLNDEYSKFHDENNEILFSTLGKKQLFDEKRLKTIYKRIIASLQDMNGTFIDSYYSSIIGLFFFLKTGFMEYEKKNLIDNPVENAVFPVVGQYCSSVTSVDGYKYSIFKVSALDSSGQSSIVKIKMITEDEFDFGCSYFCVPNINRVANIRGKNAFEKVWVSPIIIPCSIYLPQSVSTMEKLEQESDFDSAIELIYESDIRTYSAMFGSLDIAKKVLPFLLSNPKSKFYKNHYRIYKQKKEIIAIAALFDYSDSSWDSDIVLKAFGDAGVEPPSSFDNAVSSMRNVFNDYLGSSFYLVDDVCVREDFRNQGIGSSMVLYLINKTESEGKSIRLTVGEKNKIAYHMYSSLGFVPLNNETLSNDPHVEYVHMVKL